MLGIGVRKSDQRFGEMLVWKDGLYAVSCELFGVGEEEKGREEGRR